MPMRRVIRDSYLPVALEGETVSCRVRRSARRRTLALRVAAGGEVIVNAPLRAAESLLLGFVARHHDWIKTQRQQAMQPPSAWEDGRMLPYQGKPLRLCLGPVPKGRGGVQRMGDELHCQTDSPDKTEARVLRWYRDTARALLEERLASHAARIGRSVPVFRLSNARTRWGSLSPLGVVSLNWRLVKASPDEMDYVICHELAHFRERNHSPAFWQEVAHLFPQWREVRRRLRENGRFLFEF